MKYTDSEIAQENWKDIFGYDGMYQVSDLGRVRSRYSGEWKGLRPRKTNLGYLRVALCKDGKVKNFLIHRLVADAFIHNDNIFNTQINHRNECKSDNKVSNLEYCDCRYNNTYNNIRRRCRENNCKRHKIKELYNPDLTCHENIAIFKANGIECSYSTVLKLRKDLGLTKKHNYPKHYNCKRRKLEKLYREDLSITENLELFRDNGIECSRQTVYDLRNDLGLVKLENQKYKALKELYNPDLTYHENIEIFKSKGIECRKWTVWKLRKDLGLTKKYKV